MYHYFISDSKNADRRNSVYKECKKIGITPCFFDAVMGKDLSQKELTRLVFHNNFLTPGEIGCALSHLGVYREFLSTNQNHVFVFEDDAIFSHLLTSDVIKELEEFIDSQDNPSLLVLQKSIYRKSLVAKKQNIEIYDAHNLFCTHGYVLNRSAAKNIIEIQTPIRFEIDAFKFYYWLEKCNLFCLNKDLVTQSSVPSTIDNNNSRLLVSNRVKIKNNNFNELYQKLPLHKKLLANYRRFRKVLHKPFEKIDY